MKYVSAEYIPPLEEGMPGMIKAIGDDGVEYWIPAMDCDVPPWPDFLAEGGEVVGYVAPEEEPPSGTGA